MIARVWSITVIVSDGVGVRRPTTLRGHTSSNPQDAVATHSTGTVSRSRHVFNSLEGVTSQNMNLFPCLTKTLTAHDENVSVMQCGKTSTTRTVKIGQASPFVCNQIKLFDNGLNLIEKGGFVEGGIATTGDVKVGTLTNNMEVVTGYEMEEAQKGSVSACGVGA